MIRVMVMAWGADASAWIGRWVRLYRDPTVLWAGEPVGGIRIEALSDVPEGGLEVALTVKRGAKRILRLSRLVPPAVPTLDEVLATTGLTRVELDVWLTTKGKPLAGDMTPERMSALANWLITHHEEVSRG